MPAFKKEDRLLTKNYRPISVLDVFSKIFERFLSDQMVPYLNSILSVFISAYRKNYSCQHVLLHMIEMWCRCLDENKVVGAILMDLSKAFDSLPHDLLIAKLHAYGFSYNALALLLSYLSGRTQCMKNNNTFSLFKLILSGVPQGSMLGPILFNIFINDLYMLLNSNNLFNFAVDNTISAFSETVEGLINILQTETEKSFDWMENNDMIVNPDKFDAIILTKDRRDNTGREINSQ